ncbi:MAG TPA: hypothetical protein VII29_00020 [Terriglobales bacterium]
MSATATVTAVPQPTAPPKWESIGNYMVLLAYSAVVLFTVRYHEKWADEAQAWLIARDLDLKTIWFHELRYEGHPGLWHTILWIAQHVFHAPYAALGYIGVAFAIAGVAVLVLKAPFPWFIRWPLAFTYVLVYQYAVIARPYTILPLLCFLVAILFKDIEHPERMTIVLVLLTMLTLHGAILAACYGLLYLVEAIKSWPQLNVRLRDRYFICAAVLTFAFLFLVVILKPTPDVGEFATKRALDAAPEAVKATFPTALAKLTAVISGAFLDFWLSSTIFLVLAGAWCYTRRRLVLYILPMGLLIALYAKVHGYPHHHGTVFIAAITAFWIAWPSEDETRSFNVRQHRAMHGMIALLLCLFAVNIWDAAVVIQREYRYPYSGSKDAAMYLKSVGADRGKVFGFLFGVNAVQAYFDHNILANIPTAYYHNGLPLVGDTLNVAELNRVRPEYIVAYSGEPQLMIRVGIPELESRGYKMVHFSDGYYMYKQAVYQRESYFILRRVQP